MHRPLDPAPPELDLDQDFDFVFDLESLELFETTPATRPAEEEPRGELETSPLAERFARLGAWSRRMRE